MATVPVRAPADTAFRSGRPPHHRRELGGGHDRGIRLDGRHGKRPADATAPLSECDIEPENVADQRRVTETNLVRTHEVRGDTAASVGEIADERAARLGEPLEHE